MAQLSNDCFAFGGELMTEAAALEILRSRVLPLPESESVGLVAALGRVLAVDVVASRNVPPHDNAAVDGYALFHADLAAEAETVLPVGGRAAAGHPLGRVAHRGEAIRIFTGAPMPDGPDTVMMQEDCIEESGSVRLRPGIKLGANRRRAGEDIMSGHVAIPAGRRLRAQEIGVAASLGVAGLSVYRPLRVAIVSTGDELREPGAALPPGAIYDANRYVIAALLRGLGCAVSDLGILPDDRAAIRAALASAAADHDLVVSSGGMSTGQEDHVKAAVEAQGALHFWRLAIRPGRPVALGQIGRVPFVGLPGNPVAVMVTFLTLARPLILRLAGATDILSRGYTVRAGFDYKKKLGRREYLRVRLERSDAGWLARKFPRDGAGILISMVESDGLLVVSEAVTKLAVGDPVEFLPFRELLD
ncbi:MAG: molybdopterin molybdenumtransferase MoeA [Rhodospirillales bacterium]|nr:molybdopterin molybdenumtransferase MoeA [Rhodospirillales bacterium]